MLLNSKLLNRKSLICLYIFLFSFCYTPRLFAQQSLIYQLDKTNGLPTNYVYCALVDHNGYLWLGTENGVIRYNGYEIKKYDYEDGLPNVDVWDLVEDSHNRIILHSISRGIGYIRNNRYHPFKIVGIDTSQYHIIPTLYSEQDGIGYFWNKSGSNNVMGSLGSIVNDTVFINELPNIDYDNYLYTNVIPHIGLVSLDSNNVFIYPDGVKKLYCHSNNSIINYSNKYITYFNNKLLYHLFSSTKLVWLDLATCNIDSTYLPEENSNRSKKIYAHYIKNNYIYFITNKYIYKYDSSFILTASYDIDDYSITNGDNISYVIDDSLWGTGITTRNNGAFLQLQTSASRYKKTEQDYTSTIYLSNGQDSTSYWWSEETSSLKVLCGRKVSEKIKMPNVANRTHSIKKFDDKYNILDAYTCFNKDGSNSFSLFNYFKHIKAIGYDSNLIESQYSLRYQLFYQLTKDFCRIDANSYYSITSGALGLHKYSYKNRDTVTVELIDKRKFKRLLRFRAFVIAYIDDNILIYNHVTKKKRWLSNSFLKKHGINRIEHISLLDSNNLIIQDYSSLFLFNPVKNEIRDILPNTNVEGARVDVANSILTIGSRGGIVQYQWHTDHFTLIRNLPNIKGILYNEILNMCVLPNTILLGTDKGSYDVDISFHNDNRDSYSNNYRFLVSINDSIFSISNYDTIRIQTQTQSISLDVINPTGYGKLTVKYKFNESNSWQNTSDKNINLTHLNSNGYSLVDISASDDIWTSAPITIVIYKPPYWYQTNGGITVIILSILALLTIVILIAISLTRKAISRSNEKKNQQRDLELKSIYSQINPHFIFNTLGTAQYFIRKNQTKEAYAHISQFSDLLRAYLKSSRNKYISITEEVENLENYLQLQLSRFEQKFKYHITVDDKLDPTKATVPSLLLQPIVENALNHGIFHMEGTGQLNIKFLKAETGKGIICIVDDNGIGRTKSKQLRNKVIRKADSYGTILIKELVDTFNKYEPVNISIQYIDKKEPESGTTVIIHINTKTP